MSKKNNNNNKDDRIAVEINLNTVFLCKQSQQQISTGEYDLRQ